MWTIALSHLPLPSWILREEWLVDHNLRSGKLVSFDLIDLTPDYSNIHVGTAGLVEFSTRPCSGTISCRRLAACIWIALSLCLYNQSYCLNILTQCRCFYFVCSKNSSSHTVTVGRPGFWPSVPIGNFIDFIPLACFFYSGCSFTGFFQLHCLAVCDL